MPLHNNIVQFLFCYCLAFCSNPLLMFWVVKCVLNLFHCLHWHNHNHHSSKRLATHSWCILCSSFWRRKKREGSIVFFCCCLYFVFAFCILCFIFCMLCFEFVFVFVFVFWNSLMLYFVKQVLKPFLSSHWVHCCWATESFVE